MTTKPRKPMPEDPKELARAMFRGANRKVAAKQQKSAPVAPTPDKSTASPPSP